MKYDKDLYTYSGIYASDMDGELQIREEKLVKCRKPHTCLSCQREIKSAEQAVCEKGFLYNRPISGYTCLECIESWLEESGQVDDEEGGGMNGKTEG